MLEIYNEQVRDLLSKKAAVKGGMKVRQHPAKGFYGKIGNKNFQYWKPMTVYVHMHHDRAYTIWASKLKF